jgi:hypothetical protein
MSAGSLGAAGYVVLIGGKGRINADLRITSAGLLPFPAGCVVTGRW